jgi:lantibiotic modifying enzyme
MAAALARLGKATGRSEYFRAAEAALGYERSLFDTEARNWPDLRHDTPGQSFMVSWCHGAPGIALARMCLRDTPLWDANCRSELRDALSTTSVALAPEDSLCCGRSGRAAILRMANGLLHEPHWGDAAARIEGQVLSGHRAHGNYTFGDVTGVFQGAAGVGLALLDSASATNPTLLPAILSTGLLR